MVTGLVEADASFVGSLRESVPVDWVWPGRQDGEDVVGPAEILEGVQGELERLATQQQQPV